jgi:hypothetical protein
MKTFPLAVLALLTACGSAAKPDPRIATIRQQHQQILAVQDTVATQAKNPALADARGSFDAQRVVAELVQQSQTNLAVLDQLDATKSQDPGQLALVTELATKETALLRRAEASPKLNKQLITRKHTLDSISQRAKQALNEPLFK